MGTTPYSIRLDDDLRKSLEKEAEIEDRPPAQFAVRAIRSMLDLDCVYPLANTVLSAVLWGGSVDKRLLTLYSSKKYYFLDGTSDDLPDIHQA